MAGSVSASGDDPEPACTLLFHKQESTNASGVLGGLISSVDTLMQGPVRLVCLLHGGGLHPEGHEPPNGPNDSHGNGTERVLQGSPRVPGITCRGNGPPGGPCRMAHLKRRLVSHAEEIAFNDPPGGPAEQLILNQHLKRMLKYSRMSAFQRFIQQ
eukprot:scaffold121852_cov17-Tisochrysis_lutea.AAC.1